MGRFQDLAHESSDETAIDISPLMDCVFILLIFFIVTTTFVEESGFQVDKPTPAAASEMENESTTIILVLNAAGEVRHEGREVRLASVRPLVKELLGNSREEPPVVIQAEAGAKAGVLTRVADEAMLAGATRVSMAEKK